MSIPPKPTHPYTHTHNDQSLRFKPCLSLSGESRLRGDQTRTQLLARAISGQSSESSRLLTGQMEVSRAGTQISITIPPRAMEQRRRRGSSLLSLASLAKLFTVLYTFTLTTITAPVCERVSDSVHVLVAWCRIQLCVNLKHDYFGHKWCSSDEN